MKTVLVLLAALVALATTAPSPSVPLVYGYSSPLAYAAATAPFVYRPGAPLYGGYSPYNGYRYNGYGYGYNYPYAYL